MKAVVFSVDSSGMGRKIVKRDRNTGRVTHERKGRAYVRVVLGIFVESEDIPRLTEMSARLSTLIEDSVEAAVNEMQPEKKPDRKIVLKGEQK